MMDDMIRGLASSVSKYTEMSMKAWGATPEECKEMLTMGFPLVQGTHMQLIIDKIAKMPWDHQKAGEQLKVYSESGAASNNKFEPTRE